MKQRVQFKILLHTLRFLNRNVQDLIHCYTQPCSTTSADQKLLELPKARLNCHEDRAFGKASSTIWIIMALSIKSQKTVAILKSMLKKQLSVEAYRASEQYPKLERWCYQHTTLSILWCYGLYGLKDGRAWSAFLACFHSACLVTLHILLNRKYIQNQKKFIAAAWNQGITLTVVQCQVDCPPKQDNFVCILSDRQMILTIVYAISNLG